MTGQGETEHMIAAYIGRSRASWRGSRCLAEENILDLVAFLDKAGRAVAHGGSKSNSSGSVLLGL